MLKQLKKDFELVVFTAASEDYAKKVIDFIEEDNDYFDHLLHRNQCISMDK